MPSTKARTPREVRKLGERHGYSWPASDPRAERQRQAERELLTAPCRLHAAGAVCDQCPARYPTDGLGFPHASVAKDRTRCRLCRECRKLSTIDQWDREHWFRCLTCKAVAEAGGTAPRSALAGGVGESNGKD